MKPFAWKPQGLFASGANPIKRPDIAYAVCRYKLLTNPHSLNNSTQSDETEASDQHVPSNHNEPQTRRRVGSVELRESLFAPKQRSSSLIRRPFPTNSLRERINLPSRIDISRLNLTKSKFPVLKSDLNTQKASPPRYQSPSQKYHGMSSLLKPSQFFSPKPAGKVAVKDRMLNPPNTDRSPSRLPKLRSQTPVKVFRPAEVTLNTSYRSDLRSRSHHRSSSILKRRSTIEDLDNLDSSGEFRLTQQKSVRFFCENVGSN